MLRFCAATLMLLFVAGCTQSTESGVDTNPAPDLKASAAEVPTPAETDSPDADAPDANSATIDLANATEVVVTVPGMF